MTKEKLTTLKAIFIGHVLITIPGIIMLGVPGILFAVFMHKFSPHFNWQITYIVGLFVGCVITHFYWKYATPKWRQWALKQGSDEDILKNWGPRDKA